MTLPARLPDLPRRPFRRRPARLEALGLQPFGLEAARLEALGLRPVRRRRPVPEVTIRLLNRFFESGRCGPPAASRP